MGGYVYHPQVIVCQHHGVLVRSGVMGIDLGMPVEMVSGKIHGSLFSAFVTVASTSPAIASSMTFFTH